MFLALLFAAAPANAGRRVVVLDFDGPKAERFHQDVVDAIRKGKHTVVSADEWYEKADDLGASKVTGRNVQKVARKLKVEGVIVGEVEKRGQRYYLHLKLREGVSGDVVAEVEAVSRQGKLGSDGAETIKDELLPAIKELSSLNGRGDGAEEDDDEDEDRPKKKKKKGGFSGSQMDDDEDEGDDDADDDEDEDRPKKKSKKSKKSRDDDDEEDADEDDDDDDEDVDDEDEEEECTTKKCKKARAAKEKAAKEKAAKEKAAKEKAAKEKAAKEKAAKAKAAKEKAAKEKAAKAKKKKKAFDDEDEDADEDADDEDADEEADEDDDDDEDEDRVASRDDDEDEDEDDEDIRIDDDSDRDRDDDEIVESPLTPALDLGVGVSVSQRKLAFATAAGATPVQGYQGNPVAGAVVNVDVYPLAFNKKNTSITKNLGVTVMFDRVVKIESRLQYDEGGTTMTAVLGTTQQRYAAGLLYRQPVGDKLAVIGSVRYNRMKFAIDKDAAPAGVTIQIPNVDYTFVDPGIAVRYLAIENLVVGGGGSVGLVLNTGEMQTAEQYGRASVLGLDFDACASYAVTEQISVRADLRYTSFGFKFDGSGAMSDPDDDGTVDVPSGRDSYLGGYVTGTYQF